MKLNQGSIRLGSGAGRLAIWELAFLLSAFVVSVAIRAYSLSTMAIAPDELTYTYRSVIILGQHWSWPASFMLDQPPLFMYVLAAVMSVFGGNLDTLRWVSVVSGSLTIIVTYLLARSMFGKKAAVLASLVMTFNGFAIEYSRMLYIESFAILMISTAFFLFWEGLVKRKDARIAALAGLFLGLSVDTKYIALVLPLSFFGFFIIYRKKFYSTFPTRQLLAFSTTAVAAFLPVGLDLAWNQRNPFFWLLDQRFAHGNAFSTLSQVSQAGGVFSLSNMVALVAQFNHVSSLNPVQAFPPYLVDILLWATVGACVILYSVYASLFRGRATEGYILILFVLFLMFAFAYPAKRYYFFLYAAVPFAILLGGTVSKMVSRLNTSGWLRGGRRIAIPLLAGLILMMSVTAIGMSVAAVPTVYQSGFGDWDEMGRIMTYMKMNEQTNSSIATNLVPVFYYSNLYGISLQVVPLQTPVLYSTESPQQQILQTPIKPGYPYVWVISAASIQQLQPQFIVMSQTDFAGTTLAFRQYVQSHYYQPLGTKLVLLFERDGVYADSQLGVS